MPALVLTSHTAIGGYAKLRLAAMREKVSAAMLGPVLRCLIVDDNAQFVVAARAILDGDELSVVGQAANAAEALQRTSELSPDLVLLDIDLGKESGFAVARQLTDEAGDAAPKIVLISTHPGDDFADLIAESPALGFVAKSELSPAAVIRLVQGSDDSSRSA